MQDRRRFVRWQIDKPAKVKLEGAQVFSDCMVKDINLKGLQIAWGLKLQKDTFVKLSVILSDEWALNVEVWVVWQKSIEGYNIYGLYFSKIFDSDKEKIYQFVRKYFPEQINKQWWQETRKEGGEKMGEAKFNNSKDHRIFERFKAGFPVRFIDLKRNKEGQAKVRDVSAKGLGIVVNDELSPHTPLEIWLDIPDRGEPLYTRGEVVWSKLTEPGQWCAGIDLEKADLMGMARALRI